MFRLMVPLWRKDFAHSYDIFQAWALIFHFIYLYLFKFYITKRKISLWYSWELDSFQYIEVQRMNGGEGHASIYREGKPHSQNREQSLNLCKTWTTNSKNILKTKFYRPNNAQFFKIYKTLWFYHLIQFFTNGKNGNKILNRITRIFDCRRICRALKGIFHQNNRILSPVAVFFDI